jgi:hypothetical protein
MSIINYGRMVHQGRKAGLNTRDLYNAMSSLTSSNCHLVRNSSDANGFVSRVTAQGRIDCSPSAPDRSRT